MPDSSVSTQYVKSGHVKRLYRGYQSAIRLFINLFYYSTSRNFLPDVLADLAELNGVVTNRTVELVRRISQQTSEIDHIKQMLAMQTQKQGN